MAVQQGVVTGAAVTGRRRIRRRRRTTQAPGTGNPTTSASASTRGISYEDQLLTQNLSWMCTGYQAEHNVTLTQAKQHIGGLFSRF
jgi:hypothetical protein